MPRVKRGTKRRASRAKTLDLASGYFLTKSKLYRAAQEAVERGLKFAYTGRKIKKRTLRCQLHRSPRRWMRWACGDVQGAVARKIELRERLSRGQADGERQGRKLHARRESRTKASI